MKLYGIINQNTVILIFTPHENLKTHIFSGYFYVDFAQLLNLIPL
jgi:hypothetical protein